MYGYIRPYHPELKVREQEYYRAVYCGLCRTMGKCTGQCSRMTLSYDFTFFALVRMALEETSPTIHPRRCFVHPTHRRPIADPDDTLRASAGLSAVLFAHKVRDNLADETGLKRTAATLANPYAASLRRRAMRKHDAIAAADAVAADVLTRLAALESERPPSVDAPAELFGELMATLLASGLDGPRATLARDIGRHVGRWVYILDAADDFAEDAKAKRYNPFACLYGDFGMTELPLERRREIRTALLSELLGLERAFDLLDTSGDPDLGGVLSNILYLGMPREAERVLFGESPEAAPAAEETSNDTDADTPPASAHPDPHITTSPEREDHP